MITIDIQTARRFILGKQGLWPGRRWRGIKGTEQAMRAMEHLQLDPLQIIARSQDIKLHSRVIGYTPSLWEDLAYKQRKFFDWGGWLAVRPMDELPHWRALMRHERDGHSRIKAMGREHADAIVEMRAILRERETVSNRDFEMATRTRTQDYRGRKDSALALYYLWRTGEVMVHHRERFERVYTLTENVAPAHLIHESDEAEAERFLTLKEIGFNGLARLNRTSDSFQRGDPTRATQQMREALLADGDIIEVQVESFNKQCIGTISEIVPEAESSSRAFHVKVTGPCPDGVYSGMFGRILIPLDEEQVLVIPRQAVQSVGQLELVNVATKGTVGRRAVRLGRTIGNDVEVLSGLRDGEQVQVPANTFVASEANHG